MTSQHRQEVGLLLSVTIWLTIGFIGQALFSARFLLQWVASERKRAPIVPVSFWWLSLLGGGALLAYGIFRRDPVIITGQALGLFVYLRNLMLLNTARVQRARCWDGSVDNTSTSITQSSIAIEV